MISPINVMDGDENSGCKSKLITPCSQNVNVLQLSTKQNIKESPKICTGEKQVVKSADIYSLISQLDDEEQWIERTSIITKQDHEDNIQFSSDILTDLINHLPINQDDSGTVVIAAACHQPQNLTPQQSPCKATDSTSEKRAQDSGVYSPVVAPKQMYSLNLDDTDENTDPFRSEVQIPNSPPQGEGRGEGDIKKYDGRNAKAFHLELNDTDDLLSDLINGLGSLKLSISEPDSTDLLEDSGRKSGCSTADFSVDLMGKPESSSNPEPAEEAIKSAGYTVDFNHMEEMSDPFQTPKQLLNSPVRKSLSAKKNQQDQITVDEKKTTETDVPIGRKAEKELDDAKEAVAEAECRDSITENLDDVELPLTKGSYNIDFDALDENSDPFQCKKQMQNSPILPSNPAQGKNNSALDPPEVPAEDSKNLSPGLEVHEAVEPRHSDLTINLDEIDETADPFKHTKQIINSPLREEPRATYTINLDEIDESANPFKSTKQIYNTPPCPSKAENESTDEVKPEKDFKPPVSDAIDPLRPKPHEANSPVKAVKVENSPVKQTVLQNADNPFQTKSKVANSPEKQVAAEDAENPFQTKSKVANSPEKQMAAEDAENPFQTKSKVANSPEKQMAAEDAENPFQTKSKVTNSPEKQMAAEDAENPFQTKSKVANSPEKQMAAEDAENPFQTKSKVTNSPEKHMAAEDAENPFQTKSKVTNSPEKHMAAEDAENPFQTKSKVTNSPEKRTVTENLGNPFEIKTKAVNSSVSGVKDTLMTKSMIAESPAKSPRRVHIDRVGDDIPVEQAGLGEADIDPFKTKSSVVNSPQKSSGPVQQKVKMSPKKAVSDTGADPFKPRKQISNSPIKSPIRSPGGNSPDKKENTAPRWQNANSISKSPTAGKTNSPPRQTASATCSPKHSSASPNKSASSKKKSPTMQKPASASPKKNIVPPQKRSPSTQERLLGHEPMSPIMENPVATPKAIHGGKKSGKINPSLSLDATDLSTTSEDESFANCSLNKTAIFVPERDSKNVPERAHRLPTQLKSPLPDINEEHEEFRSAAEVFGTPAFIDASGWDMLEKVGSDKQDMESELSRMSLYVKFDPLVNAGHQLKSVSAEGQKRMSYSRRTSMMGRYSSVGTLESKPDINLFGTPPSTKAAKAVNKKIEGKDDMMSGLDEIFTCNPPVENEGRSSPFTQPSGELIEVLQYSDKDIKKIQNDLELKYQSDQLIKERAWCTEKQGLEEEVKDLKEKLKDLEEKREDLLAQTLKMSSNNEDFKLINAEYEKTILELVEEIEKVKGSCKEKITAAEMEKEKAFEEVQSVENFFSELHTRFEKARAVITSMKKNEEIYKNALAERDARLDKLAMSYKKLKEQAEEKLSKACGEIEKIENSKLQEVTRLEAEVKKLNFQKDGQKKIVEQQALEIKELTQLCDELIVKFQAKR